MAVAVPDDLDVALTPEWLTSALQPRYPGVEVHTVERGPVVERLSTNARFTIDGRLPEDLPRQLCIKGYFSEFGPHHRVRRRARGRLLPRPRRIDRSPHPAQRVRRRRPEEPARCGDHARRGRRRRRLSRRQQPIRRRPGRRRVDRIGPAARRHLGDHAMGDAAVAGAAAGPCGPRLGRAAHAGDHDGQPQRAQWY